MAVTIDTAVDMLTATLKNMRELGHPVPQQLAFVKSKLYDESFLMRSDRQQVLKKVNRLLGVSWSMSQIKNATIEEQEAETVIETGVSELKGSVSVNIGGQPAGTAFAGLGVKVEKSVQADQDHKHLATGEGKTTGPAESVEKQVKEIDLSGDETEARVNRCKRFLAENDETFESLEQLVEGGWLLKSIDKNQDKVTYNFTVHGHLINRGYVELAENFISTEIDTIFGTKHAAQADQQAQDLIEEPTGIRSFNEQLEKVLRGRCLHAKLIMPTLFGGKFDRFVLATTIGTFATDIDNSDIDKDDWVLLYTNEECEVRQVVGHLPPDLVEAITHQGRLITADGLGDDALQKAAVSFSETITKAFPNFTSAFKDYLFNLGLPDNHTRNYRPLRPVITIGENQTHNSNTQPEGSDTMNDNIPQNQKSNFEGFLLALGKTPEDREAFIHQFLESSETYKNGYATFKVSNAHLNEAEALFLFAEANPEVSRAVVDMAANKHLEQEGLKHSKSRFSLTGENEEAGPRGAWIGFGSAVIGGGIEMFSRDGATVGAAIGTLGAAVGSFLGGELVDKHVESRLGRYVAAGMLGLGAGSLGSAIGRNLITGVQIPDFIVRTVSGGEPVAAVVVEADL